MLFRSEYWRARGIQAKLSVRAVTAPSPHEQRTWSRVALLHELVRCRHLDPAWAKDLAFLGWLHESGRIGGPDDGSPGCSDTASIESTTPTWWRRPPARCRRCGRFVRGRVPRICTGCSAVHCPFCLKTDGCAHILAVVADGDVRPSLVDPASIPMLTPTNATPWEPKADELRTVFGRLYPLLDAYTDGLGSPPNAARLTQHLLELVGYPIAVVSRDTDAVHRGVGHDACYFSWGPDVARHRIGQVVAGLRRGFERLAIVIGEDRPTRALARVQDRRCQSGRHQRSELPDVLIVTCGDQEHRISLPSRGPVVLLDHPDRQLVETLLARRDGIEGCFLALRYVRGRAGHNLYGWYKWGVHVAPSFGQAGSAIRDRLKEFDQRRKLRRLLRDADFG